MAAETKPYRLSNSKVKTWRRCPKQFEYRYVHGLRSKRKAVQLKRGSWLHDLLMAHYDGEDWLQRHAAHERDFYNLFEEEREEYGDLPGECLRVFTSYLMNYKQQDAGLHVVDSELNEIVILPNGDEFNFIIDLVVEEPDGGLWLWDHKTVSSFMPADFMLLDAQLARYFWSAEKMGYKPIRGVLFNELITKAPTVPKFLEKSQRLEMRANIACDVYTYFREIKRLGLDPKPYNAFLRRLKTQNDRWFRRTRLPRDRALVATQMREMMWSADEMKHAEATGHFPRAPMKDCSWSCEFLELCAIQLQGGDVENVLKHRYTIRPPRESNDG